tara:strand:- start:2276 stop:3184 length:909 start_codon:yes stop_codon:yes gene_type:complete
MKALSLLIISGTLTAALYMVRKLAGVESIPVLLFLFWQLSGSALVVWLFSLRSRTYPVWNLEHVKYYLIGGLLGTTIPFILVFIVLEELQVGLVGLLTALSPIVTYFLARVVGCEQASMLRLSGLVVGLAGVAYLLTSGESINFSAHWFSLLLALMIPVTLAISNIYRSRYWPDGSEATAVVIGMLIINAGLLFLINLWLGNFQINILKSSHAAYLIYILPLLAGAAYISSFKLLKVGGPVYLSQMGYVITVVTILAGIIFWDERYYRNDFISISLVFAGVLMTTWSSDKKFENIESREELT